MTANSDYTQACARCGSLAGPHDIFCGQCGRELAPALQQARGDAFAALTPALVYYFLTLFLLMVYKFTPAFPSGFEGQVVISLIDIVIVIAFALHARHDLAPLFSVSQLRFRLVVLTIAGALAGSLVIAALAKFINVSISDDVFYDPYLFQDTQYPLLISILFICVQPAIFEELAFRGFLFGNLQRVTSPLGALYISGFLFGLMHLSYISMIWLVPIGLAFAYLRLRYNTLWYGMIGHFFYNLGITLIEYYQLF